MCFITGLTLLQSCIAYPVVQYSMNMPLSDTSKELKVGVNYGTDGAVIHTSYTPDTKHVLMANFVSDANSAEGAVPHNFEGDIAAGYYYKLGARPDHQGGRFEVLGGLGYGNVNTQASVSDQSPWGDPTTNQTITGQFGQAYVQADIGGVRGRFEYGFGLQAKYVYFSGNDHIVQTQQNMYNLSEVNDYINPFRTTSLFLQIGCQVAYLFPHFKIYSGIGFSSTSGMIYIPWAGYNTYVPFYINIGVAANIFRIK